MPPDNDANLAASQCGSAVASCKHRTPSGWGSLGMVGAVAARLAGAINADLKLRRSIRQLTGLSDYELCDLGLSRWDVERFVHGRL